MSALAAINNSTIAITADAPCVLVVVVGVIPATGGQNIFTVNSQAILMESDLNTWAGTYASAYTNPSGGYVTPGAVIGTGVSNVQNLTSTTTINGTVFVTINTTFQLDLSVTTPAQNTVPSPDPTTTYSAQCSFTSVIQNKLSCA